MEHNNKTDITLTNDVDFDINATDITPIASGNSTLNELRKSNEDLLAEIKKFEMEQQKKQILLNMYCALMKTVIITQYFQK